MHILLLFRSTLSMQIFPFWKKIHYTFTLLRKNYIKCDWLMWLSNFYMNVFFPKNYENLYWKFIKEIFLFLRNILYGLYKFEIMISNLFLYWFHFPLERSFVPVSKMLFMYQCLMILHWIFVAKSERWL